MPQEKKMKVYRVALPDGQIVLFLPSPRKRKATRGHNPDCHYSGYRSAMREARRKMGWPSGRQWVKFRKFGQKAYRKYVLERDERGMNDNPTD